jgi:hypothetical protein
MRKRDVGDDSRFYNISSVKTISTLIFVVFFELQRGGKAASMREFYRSVRFRFDGQQFSAFTQNGDAFLFGYGVKHQKPAHTALLARCEAFGD